MTQKKILLISVGILAVVGLVAIAGYDSSQTSSPSNSESYDDAPVVYETSEESIAPPTKEYGLDDTFEVGDFTISLGNNYTFTTVQNQYADDYGEPLLKLPLTETNNGTSAGQLNMYGVNSYGPNGKEISWSVGALYSDSKVNAGNLLQNATQTSYLYLPYEGDGLYTIIFNSGLSDEIIAKLEISR